MRLYAATAGGLRATDTRAECAQHPLDRLGLGAVPEILPPRLVDEVIDPGYQHLLSRIAGIQQCWQHVIRRCRAVAGLGPGSLQSWSEDVIAILREAHRAVEGARARGDTSLDPGRPIWRRRAERFGLRPAPSSSIGSQRMAAERAVLPLLVRRVEAMDEPVGVRRT